jgi:hypothetical protein
MSTGLLHRSLNELEHGANGSIASTFARRQVTSTEPLLIVLSVALALR